MQDALQKHKNVGLLSTKRCCMAQWFGQFSGHTHATKVEDAEDALRHAVAAFRTATPDERARKAKSVRSLAERLLVARLKLLKARVAALEPKTGDLRSSTGIDSLKEREAKTRAEGVSGILVEFGRLMCRGEAGERGERRYA